MAELSVDEAQRLARLFLTGQAGQGELQRFQNALADDAGAALELLTQMQAALDDSAPAGLSAEQDRAVNGRIEALIAPRVKKRGFFAFFLRLFKGKPKLEEAPTRVRRRGGSAEAEAPAPPPVSEPVPDSMGETLPGGEGMEDMAPIAAAPAAAAEEAPAAPRKGRAKAAAKESKPFKLPAWILPALGLLLVLGAVAFGVKWWFSRPKAAKTLAVAPLPAVQATPGPKVQPGPTLVPTPLGSRRRGVAMADSKGRGSETLPAEINPVTPVPAGQ